MLAARSDPTAVDSLSTVDVADLSSGVTTVVRQARSDCSAVQVSTTVRWLRRTRRPSCRCVSERGGCWPARPRVVLRPWWRRWPTGERSGHRQTLPDPGTSGRRRVGCGPTTPGRRHARRGPDRRGRTAARRRGRSIAGQFRSRSLAVAVASVGSGVVGPTTTSTSRPRPRAFAVTCALRSGEVTSGTIKVLGVGLSAAAAAAGPALGLVCPNRRAVRWTGPRHRTHRGNRQPHQSARPAARPSGQGDHPARLRPVRPVQRRQSALLRAACRPIWQPDPCSVTAAPMRSVPRSVLLPPRPCRGGSGCSRLARSRRSTWPASG